MWDRMQTCLLQKDPLSRWSVEIFGGVAATPHYSWFLVYNKILLSWEVFCCQDVPDHAPLSYLCYYSIHGMGVYRSLQNVVLPILKYWHSSYPSQRISLPKKLLSPQVVDVKYLFFFRPQPSCWSLRIAPQPRHEASDSIIKSGVIALFHLLYGSCQWNYSYQSL